MATLYRLVMLRIWEHSSIDLKTPGGPSCYHKRRKTSPITWGLAMRFALAVVWQVLGAPKPGSPKSSMPCSETIQAML